MDNTITTTTTNTTSTRIDSSIKERRKPGFQVENPFTLKVGQVFTGFGVGCGVGIGVGRPLNLGAIPALQQVMSAARGATDAFSGAGRHVNSTLRRFGAKNIEAGVGCGIGFGHGFGAGLALKPGVVHRLQSCLAEIMAKVMMKVGTFPGLSMGQTMLPPSLQSSISALSETSMQNPVGNITSLTSKTLEHTAQVQTKDGNLGIGSAYKHNAPKGMPSETSFGRTEKVISSFLQNPAFKGDEDNGSAGHLRSENNVLQLVLKHQKVIDDLMEENEKLRQILVEELKVHPSKFQTSSTSGVKTQNPCSDCFDCRRKQRKNR
ncbi:hypothetical protein MKW98_000875 [Papaver atlanticum]|uniref:Uncharacterized protein n=1 Tax=Papaver atlanticum TaxID=357466 RepID=A0AAD4XBQ5_9MAGN|nr:hypothetical protein MKW98_000875 [Papaver atlanticum]